ncbi:MAG: hypothetical protein RL722_1676, partial [Pseudomonadota bacterium]
MSKDAPAPSLLTSLRLRRGAGQAAGAGRRRRWKRWVVAALGLAGVAAFV